MLYALYSVFFFKKKFVLNIRLFSRDRETECEWGRGRERGRHRIRSGLQALSCQHRAQEPNAGLEPTNGEIIT